MFEGGVFELKKKKKKIVLLYTMNANYIGANYPNKK